jgi:hypothetical protein
LRLRPAACTSEAQGEHDGRTRTRSVLSPRFRPKGEHVRACTRGG